MKRWTSLSAIGSHSAGARLASAVALLAAAVLLLTVVTAGLMSRFGHKEPTAMAVGAEAAPEAPPRTVTAAVVEPVPVRCR